MICCASIRMCGVCGRRRRRLISAATRRWWKTAAESCSAPGGKRTRCSKKRITAWPSKNPAAALEGMVPQARDFLGVTVKLQKNYAAPPPLRKPPRPRQLPSSGVRRAETLDPRGACLKLRGQIVERGQRAEKVNGLAGFFDINLQLSMVCANLDVLSAAFSHFE